MNLGLNASIMVIVMKRFDEDVFLKTIQDFKISSLMLVPPLAVFLTKTPKAEQYDLSCIQEAYCGAAPLSVETEKALKKRYV